MAPAPPQEPAAGNSWDKYMNENGEFDPPSGSQLDRVMTGVMGTMNELAVDVVGEKLGPAIRECILEVLQRENEFVRETISNRVNPEMIEEAIANYEYDKANRDDVREYENGADIDKKAEALVRDIGIAIGSWVASSW